MIIHCGIEELDKGGPLSPILFNLFINDIFNDFSELGIPLGESRCCGGTKIKKKKKKLLKRVKWMG